jgi:hypothetical protein
MIKKALLVGISVVFTLSLIIFYSAGASSHVSVDLSAYSVWWNDSVTARGRALDSGNSPITGADVNLTVSGERCDNITDPSGYWTCTFNAPLELGNYTVDVRIGSTLTNSTGLNVLLRYGNPPIGKTDRVVYEQPILIQELSGRIRTVWARVMVWRG